MPGSRWGLAMSRCVMLLLAVLTTASSAQAVDTLDVKATVNTTVAGEWTAFALEESLLGGFPTPDGSVWFGTRSGAVRYDNARWLLYTSQDGLLDAPVYQMMQTDDGSLWFPAGLRWRAMPMVSTFP